MIDPLFPVELPPGLFRNGTVRQARGRWYDGNLVRFFSQRIGPVGGWLRLKGDDQINIAALTGKPRAALAYRSDSHGILQAFGTHQKLYAITGGSLHDITPVGFTEGIPDSANVLATGKYGAGLYGVGRYGRGPQTLAMTPADTWQLVNFGDRLVAVCTSNRKIYTWDGDPSVLPAIPAAAPTSVLGVVATPERYLFALGAQYNAAASAFVANSRSVAWAAQETTDDWDPTVPNTTAGDFELTTPGKLMCGRVTRGETLLFTDTDAHVASWIGGVFIYSFKRVGENCGIISPNAVAMPGGQAMWMGANSFYTYDGFVKTVPCDVHDHVFGDLNRQQAVKSWAVTNSAFNEVWFFYPSTGSTEVDRYVVFNYVENHWTTGALSRTTGYDAGTVPDPILVAPTGEIYEHEQTGASHDGALPFLESGPIEPGEGDRQLRVNALVPDVISTNDLQLTIYGAADATSVETVNGPYALDGHPTPARFIAKQLRLRYDALTDADWRVGILRVSGRPSSRR